MREILAKARELKGLDMDEVAVLTSISDPELLGELFTTARDAKDAIYGSRLVLFAPLYVSNLCNNDCLYCAFRVRNKELKRRALTQDEIRHEIELLVDQGHKRVLLVAGESYPKQGFGYVLDSIATIYEVKRGNGEIRRVNVNVAPLAWTSSGSSRPAASAPTSSSRRPTTARPTRPCTWAAASATTTGASRPCTAPWRPASTTSASACCSACRLALRGPGHAAAHPRARDARSASGPHTISVPRLEPALRQRHGQPPAAAR